MIAVKKRAMRISGFTMARNAGKLYYPILEAIESILPIVDEFIVALGTSDPDDDTESIIAGIGSPKIRVIHTIWDLDKYPDGTENAHQTDIAKNACSGDWLFYLQADEVVHEKFLPVIRNRCEELLFDKTVDGLLFSYIHFWADYQHFHNAHGWYPHEIRIIRNDPDIHSWESAQSFRKIPGFDGLNYRQQKGTYKLRVAKMDAEIFHYGWVRPPQFMQSKRRALDTIHKGAEVVQKMYEFEKPAFDYGPLRLAKKFKGTHPKVMEKRISCFDWGGQLRVNGPVPANRQRYKHEKWKYRFLTFFEQNLLKGKSIFGFKNYILLKK